MTTCKSCGTDVDSLAVFPGGLCLPCYRPVGERLARTMTADDLTRAWGGPSRHSWRRA